MGTANHRQWKVQQQIRVNKVSAEGRTRKSQTRRKKMTKNHKITRKEIKVRICLTRLLKRASHKQQPSRRLIWKVSWRQVRAQQASKSIKTRKATRKARSICNASEPKVAVSWSMIRRASTQWMAVSGQTRLPLAPSRTRHPKRSKSGTLTSMLIQIVLRVSTRQK